MTGSERLVWSPPAYGVVVVGDAIVQLWEREAPASAFRALLGHLEERKRASPERPLWMIAVSSDEASMPALVIEGTGFRASAARGVMASMTMMSSKRARPHVVATVQEACATLAQASGGALDPSALVRSIGEARDALRR